MKLLWILIVGMCLCGSMGNPDPLYSEFVQKFREEALERHNMFREGYAGSQPLEINDHLCQTSQARAEEWSEKFSLSENVPYNYGENEYLVPLKKNVEIYGSTAVDAWYDQIHDYDFTSGKNAPNTNSEIDSFTQLVWKASKEMCISYAIGINYELGTKILYVIAHYKPGGAVKGAEIDNVKPIFASPHFFVNSKYAPKPNHLTEPITDAFQIPDFDETMLFERTTFDKTGKLLKLHDCGKFPKEKNVSTPIEWIEEVIHTANGYRALHGVPDLIHNYFLDQVAQKIANNVAELNLITTPKSKIRGCGETVFTKVEGIVDPSEPIDTWYKQIHIYDFQHERSRDKKHSVDAFTQLVWKNTKEMGIAFAKKDGKTYVVGIYAPVGNKANEYKQNVFSGANRPDVRMFFIVAAMLALAYQCSRK